MDTKRVSEFALKFCPCMWDSDVFHELHAMLELVNMYDCLVLSPGSVT